MRNEWLEELVEREEEIERIADRSIAALEAVLEKSRGVSASNAGERNRPQTGG